MVEDDGKPISKYLRTKNEWNYIEFDYLACGTKAKVTQ
jgi:hypothetical protein